MTSITELKELYRMDDVTPTNIVNQVLETINTDSSNAWITVRDRKKLLERTQELESRSIDSYPLYGVPFAIKDNIDVAGLSTTAACPEYEYIPEETAPVVDKLIEAGAILIGKTNMDQFATGLVGTRSPYGVCRNPENEEYISGGSSSGSAVVVATGQVAFAIGTDTAGSGRVPPAFNGLVGLKPTRGAVSTRGVVPACRTLDCVAIFAKNIDGIRQVGEVAIGYDRHEPYSRSEAEELTLAPPATDNITIGIPDESNTEFFGDSECQSLFENIVDELDSLPWSIQTIDFDPFVQAAELLYQGPWVAERYSAVGDFIETNPDAVNSVVGDIIRRGDNYSATDTFEAYYELEEYKREVSTVFKDIDVLVTPTTGTTYTIKEIQNDPIELNSNLGYYNNFANLLDLSAITVPGGKLESGVGFGITIFGEAFADGLVTAIGEEIKQE